MLKKILVALAICLVAFWGGTTPAQAQEGDTTAQCTISINGVTAIPYSRDGTTNGVVTDYRDVPLTVPSRFEGGTKYYDFNVVLSDAAAQRFTSCGVGDQTPDLKVELLADYIGSLPFIAPRGWTSSDEQLITRNPFTFSATAWNLDRDEPGSIIPIKVSTEDNSKSSCRPSYNICQLYAIRLNGNALEETADCAASISDFTSTLADQLPSQVTTGEPVTITNNFMDEFANCHGVGMNFSIRYLANNGSQSFSMDVQRGLVDNPTTNTFTFTPSQSGQYIMTVTFLGDGETWGIPEMPWNDQAGGATEEIASPFLHGFCATLEGETCVPPVTDTAAIEPNPYVMCNQIPDGPARQECCDCATGSTTCNLVTEVKGVWTAVGCIDTNAPSIVSSLMKVGLSIAGGVTVLTILAAGFLFSTSQGDAKRTGEAKDMMTSAIVGILFIIFSVTMLRFIGVDVLQIPGFAVRP